MIVETVREVQINLSIDSDKSVQRPVGTVEMILYKLGGMPDCPLTRRLKERGFSDVTMVAHLNEFYPNGKGLDESAGEHMREGRGARALDRLIEVAQRNRAEVMYVFTGKASMINFLIKHGFEAILPVSLSSGAPRKYNIYIMKLEPPRDAFETQSLPSILTLRDGV